MRHFLNANYKSMFTISDYINKHIDSGEQSTLQPANLPAPASAPKYVKPAKRDAKV